MGLCFSSKSTINDYEPKFLSITDAVNRKNISRKNDVRKPNPLIREVRSRNYVARFDFFQSKFGAGTSQHCVKELSLDGEIFENNSDLNRNDKAVTK